MVSGEVRVSRTKGYVWERVNVERREREFCGFIYLLIPMVTELDGTFYLLFFLVKERTFFCKY